MNAKIKNISIAIALGLFILSACSTQTPQPITGTATLDTITIANPASAYCEEQGFKLEKRIAELKAEDKRRSDEFKQKGKEIKEKLAA